MYYDNSQQSAPPPPPQQSGSPYQQQSPGTSTGRGKGCGFWLAVVLAVVFFFSTIFMGFLWVTALIGAAFSTAVEDQGFIKETISGVGPNEVLLVPVEGIITGDPGGAGVRLGTAGMISRQFDLAEKDEKIKAVILSIDSPGGVITACDILYNHLKSFDKPVVAYLNDTAASGGYYIACAADEIIAHPTSITGNVGVIMPRVNLEGLLDKVGVRVESIKSAERKDIGSPYREMEQEELDYLQDIVSELHERFAEVVRESLNRRGVTYSDDDFQMMTSGLPFTGLRAAEIGMIDSTGYMNDAIRRAEARSGAANLRVVTYSRPFRFRDIISSGGLVVDSRLPLGLNDIEDMALSPYPRFMYLWSSGREALLSSHDYDIATPAEMR